MEELMVTMKMTWLKEPLSNLFIPSGWEYEESYWKPRSFALPSTYHNAYYCTDLWWIHIPFYLKPLKENYSEWCLVKKQFSLSLQHCTYTSFMKTWHLWPSQKQFITSLVKLPVVDMAFLMIYRAACIFYQIKIYSENPWITTRSNGSSQA